MTARRARILTGMAAGALWAAAVVALPQRLSFGPDALLPALAMALLPPGLVMMAMIGTLARRRFFDDLVIDGQPFPPGSPGDIDQRVLVNTAEQALLAVLIWPFAALVLGPPVAIALGGAFAVTRIAFWAGYHVAPPLRAFGFAGTFYPTVLAALWSLAAAAL